MTSFLKFFYVAMNDRTGGYDHNQAYTNTTTKISDLQ